MGNLRRESVGEKLFASTSFSYDGMGVHEGNRGRVQGILGGLLLEILHMGMYHDMPTS